jgi:phosphosulfolactate phosphohydrolase-like enzyme
MITVVKGSKRTILKESGLEKFLVTADGNKQFWADDNLKCGVIVQITEKKAGTKYTDKKDGTEKVVKYDGYNLDFVIGSKEQAAEFTAAKIAAKELDF